ncbi:hypothetical protein GY45DRAFT_949319 [Cubamyces sp. BRFM 1775]|nr:hypothetical protein GY45DRAFT_949319 [Cubamyces sp. BRFM 1775]
MGRAWVPPHVGMREPRYGVPCLPKLVILRLGAATLVVLRTGCKDGYASYGESPTHLLSCSLWLGHTREQGPGEERMREMETEAEAGARLAQHAFATLIFVPMRRGEGLTMGSVRDEFVAHRELARRYPLIVHCHYARNLDTQRRLPYVMKHDSSSEFTRPQERPSNPAETSEAWRNHHPRGPKTPNRRGPKGRVRRGNRGGAWGQGRSSQARVAIQGSVIYLTLLFAAVFQRCSPVRNAAHDSLS